jgi:hypothetical protein
MTGRVSEVLRDSYESWRCFSSKHRAARSSRFLDSEAGAIAESRTYALPSTPGGETMG